MSKPVTFLDTPKCPHCSHKAEPPKNRYEETREYTCLHCGGRYLVRQVMHYTVEPLQTGTGSLPQPDFVCDWAEDKALTDCTAQKLAGILKANMPTSDRNHAAWSLVYHDFPGIPPLRQDGLHNFTLLSDNRTVRVYHGKGCLCVRPLPTDVATS